MKNYETMTKRELQRELERAGEFYLVNANITKKDMIEILRRNDEARSMTLTELAEASDRWQTEQGVQRLQSRADAIWERLDNLEGCEDNPVYKMEIRELRKELHEINEQLQTELF
jgi:hypothetical protein